MVVLALLEGTRSFERREMFCMPFPLVDPRPHGGYELSSDIQLVDVAVARGAE
jgi:hypothetical protein